MERSLKEVGNYRFYENDELGKGNYGKVYKGTHMTLGIKVAIKQIPKSVFTSEKLTELVIREITITKTVHHPNIVRCLDAIQTTNNLYIITELCDGITLEKHLQDKKYLPEKEALKYLKQIISAYNELYDKKIIHRDIKPANLIFNSDQLKICDLGFAKVVKDESKTNTILGTPLYMSPELLRGEPYSNKCDVWALGFVFYQMLYGITPWTGASQKSLLANISENPLKFDDKISVSEASKDLLRKMLDLTEDCRISWSEIFKNPLIKSIPYEPPKIIPVSGSGLSDLVINKNRIKIIGQSINTRKSSKLRLSIITICCLLSLTCYFISLYINISYIFDVYIQINKQN